MLKTFFINLRLRHLRARIRDLEDFQQDELARIREAEYNFTEARRLINQDLAKVRALTVNERIPTADLIFYKRQAD